MAIPDYQSIMLPLLRLASDGQAHVVRDAVNALAEQFKLTPEERQQELPSRTQPIFEIFSVGLKAARGLY